MSQTPKRRRLAARLAEAPSRLWMKVRSTGFGRLARASLERMPWLAGRLRALHARRVAAIHAADVEIANRTVQGRMAPPVMRDLAMPTDGLGMEEILTRIEREIETARAEAVR